MNGDTQKEVQSPKSPKKEQISLRQAINDSVNQYLSLSGEENESLSDPASPRLKNLRDGSNSASDDKLSASNEVAVTPSPLTPSPQPPVTPHERLNPPTRSAPRRGSRRRPSRNRTVPGPPVTSQNTPTISKSGPSSESLINSTKSSTASNSLGVNHEPIDVFERLNDGPSLEGWRTEQTPNNSTAPTPSATPLETDPVLESESNPASPSEQHSEPQPLLPKLDLSSLTKVDSPQPSKSTNPATSENESQPEGDLTVVNTPRTSPDCEEAKARQNNTVPAESRPRASQASRERRAKQKTKSLPHYHKKQSSAESDLGVEKKSRGRPRNRPLALDDHLSKLKNAVRELEERMAERRDVARRIEGIESMTELQLREEKAELQRELLIFESNWGRPQGGADRQAVRLIYHRYRELKKRLSKLDNRSASDQEAFMREIESELLRIERERRELGRAIKTWESSFRLENGRSPANDEKNQNGDYSRYKHLRARRTFLQDLQQQKAPESFTV